MAILKNVELQWCFETKKSKLSNKFEVTCAHLDKEHIKTIASLGVKAKKCDKEGDANRGIFVVPRTNFQPEVVGPDGKTLYQFAPETTIGNGTIANVQVHAYNWEFGGKTGKSLNLDKIQIVKLVPFKLNGGNEFSAIEDVTEMEDDFDLNSAIED